MSISEDIRRRISEVLSLSDLKRDWMKRSVENHVFLPLYVGWVATLGIRPDGSFVRWTHDDGGSVEPLDDAFWQRMAICQGVKKYPELRSLLPERPSRAETCSVCDGAGERAGAPQIICECGGAGWVIPNEPRGPSPG